MSKEITVIITDDEEKALLSDINDIDVWAFNAVENKVKQCVNSIVKRALTDTSNTVLSVADKEQLMTVLNSKGIIIPTIDIIPYNIKLEIVKRSNI